MDALEHLLRSPVGGAAPRIASLDAWIRRLDECPLNDGVDRAFWAGFEADRLGYAFVGGYQAALKTLLDRTAGVARAKRRFSLAASESGGAHPRAITTSLADGSNGLVLRGEKSFATLASVADELLVVATRGVTASGQNQLSLVRIPVTRAGVTIVDREPTPFAPEIPHARVTLADVAVSETDVLPGDGYASYLKPFRTIEDIHVLAAALGYVLRVARTWAFVGTMVEAAYAHANALRLVARGSAADPTGHVALAGIFDGVRRLIATYDDEWSKTDEGTRDRWHRDLALFVVADAARNARTEAAWKALGAPRPG